MPGMCKNYCYPAMQSSLVVNEKESKIFKFLYVLRLSYWVINNTIQHQKMTASSLSEP